jgi:hypothetical protein
MKFSFLEKCFIILGILMIVIGAKTVLQPDEINRVYGPVYRSPDTFSLHIDEKGARYVGIAILGFGVGMIAWLYYSARSKIK